MFPNSRTPHNGVSKRMLPDVADRPAEGQTPCPDAAEVKTFKVLMKKNLPLQDLSPALQQRLREARQRLRDED